MIYHMICITKIHGRNYIYIYTNCGPYNHVFQVRFCPKYGKIWGKHIQYALKRKSGNVFAYPFFQNITNDVNFVLFFGYEKEKD